jgi:cytochrome c-type biogenesis protein CcmF
MTVALPAIVSSPAGDLYVTLLSADTAGKAELRLAVNPMVGWIWAGGALMVAGGVCAAWPRRRRSRAAVDEPVEAPEALAPDAVLVGER